MKTIFAILTAAIIASGCSGTAPKYSPISGGAVRILNTQTGEVWEYEYRRTASDGTNVYRWKVTPPIPEDNR